MFEDIIEKLRVKVAEELDEEIPDGDLQKLAGWCIELIGTTVAGVGVELAGPQNTDGDE